MTAVTADKSRARPSLIALDLMRGLAALAVLVAHLRGNAFVEYGALPPSQHSSLTVLFFFVTRLGHEAVIVFFVLSGFLVGGRVLTRLRDRNFELYDYSVDRATRILIPLIPACLYTAAIGIVCFGEGPPVGQLIANMVGLNEIVTDSLGGNGALWSLAYEIWFYILGGAAAYTVSKRPNLIGVVILAVCGLVFAILQTRYLVFWIIGAAITLCMNIRFKGLLALIGLTLGLSGTLLYELAADSHSITAIVFVRPIVSEYMICIGVAIALPFLAGERVDRSLWRLKTLAAALAAFSYTLYLTHRPTDAASGLLFGKASALSVHSLTSYGVRILICLAVATCFYFVFEHNTGKVRRMLHKHKSSLLRIGLPAGVDTAR